MPLQCNINSHGRVARLIYGILLLLLGIALVWFWAWPDGHAWRWAIAITCMVGGAFAVFEARAGWCVVRAMGIKTPM